LSVNAKPIKVCLIPIVYQRFLYTDPDRGGEYYFSSNSNTSIEFEKPRLILLVLKNLGSKVTNQIEGKFPERSASVCNVVDSLNFVGNLLFTF
jgi:YHS domain-containing protein